MTKGRLARGVPFSCLAIWPYPSHNYSMSDFDDFFTTAAPEFAGEMADPISFGSSSTARVDCTFDALEMSTGIERYGDTESITARVVVAMASLESLPKQKTRVYRHNTRKTYYVVSVSTDAGHVELSLTEDGAKRGNG